MNKKLLFHRTSELIYSKSLQRLRESRNIIYLALDKNDKPYVGQTSVTFIERIKTHIRKKRTDFEKAIILENQDDFKWAILENSLKSKSYLNEREKYWINHYDSCNIGYNKTTGGKGTKDFKHPENSKKANSERRKLFFSKKENRDKQSSSNKIAHAINPNQAKEHSALMKNRFDKNSKKGRKNREIAAEKTINYYNQKENILKHVLSYGKPPFLVFKNDILLGLFLSQAECSRLLNLDKGKISMVLSGKRKKTGGYTMKYMEKTYILFEDVRVERSK